MPVNPSVGQPSSTPKPPPIKLSKSGKFYRLSKLIAQIKINQCVAKIKISLEAQTPPKSDFKSSEEEWSGVFTHTIKEFDVSAKTNILIKTLMRRSLAYPDLSEIRVAVLLISQLKVANKKTGEESIYLYIQRELTEDPLECGITAAPIDTPAFLAQFLETQNNETPRIEQLTMQMMASSRGEIRRKRIDAYNVGTTTSSLGLHRTIAGPMILAAPPSSGSRTVSVSPHRQSVRSGSSRMAFSDVMQWACERSAGFARTRNTVIIPSDFLSQMAQPLLDLHKKTPSSVWIEKNDFAELIKNYNNLNGTTWSQPKSTKPKHIIPDIEELLEYFSEPIELSPQAYKTNGDKISSGNNEETVIFKSVTPIFPFSDAPLELRVTSKTCKIKLPTFTGFLHLGEADEQPKSVMDLLNKHKSFRVVFDKGQALYCSEGAYASANTTLAVEQLIHIFKPIKALESITSEKGEVPPKATHFEKTSSFYIIETDPDITHKDSILICDDDTREWCDYIEISAKPTRIRWLHAKVQQLEKDQRARTSAKKSGSHSGAPSPLPKKLLPMSSNDTSSASKLQEVVGQALKNLSRLRVTKQDHEFAPRRDKWLTQYCVLPTKGEINRLRRPVNLNADKLDDIFDDAASNPTALYEVGIVIPNYSLRYLEDEMKKILIGKASQHVLQAFWLLSGYMHACLEVGAQPIVFVRP